MVPELSNKIKKMTEEAFSHYITDVLFSKKETLRTKPLFGADYNLNYIMKL